MYNYVNSQVNAKINGGFVMIKSVKKFSKKSLAILIALLMIISVMPFTPPISVEAACAVCIAIAGFYLLLKAEKVGFYLLIVGCLINAVLAYVQYCNINVDDYGTMYSVARSMAFKGVWTSIGKIIFFMLLMLLKCDGKNVYQVLWNK